MDDDRILAALAKLQATTERIETCADVIATILVGAVILGGVFLLSHFFK